MLRTVRGPLLRMRCRPTVQKRCCQARWPPIGGRWST